MPGSQRLSEAELTLLGAPTVVGDCVTLCSFPLTGEFTVTANRMDVRWPREPFTAMRKRWLARHASVHNGRKLAFTGWSTEPRAIIHLCETDWAAVQSTQEDWRSQPPPAWRAGAIGAIRADRSFRYPNIAVVHGVLISADRRVLLSRRSSRLNYYPLHWSASFEEGLELEQDGADGWGAFESAARRGLREEFGWTSAVIDAMHCHPASLVMEVANGNPALVVVVTAAIAMDDLIDSSRPSDEVEVGGLQSLAIDSEDFERLAASGVLRDEMRVHPTALQRAREALRYDSSNDLR